MAVEGVVAALAAASPLVQGLVGGTVIALFNAFGALLVLVWRDPSERALDGALGFAAGVMLAASFTSLLLPGIDFASRPAYRALSIGGVALDGIVPVLVGFVLGALLLDRADDWVPHVHVVVTGDTRRDPGRGNPRTASVLLFIVAITLHNMPEGLAVGVGFGSGNVGDALALMLAIGVQNVPEGLAVSVAAINAGFGRYFYAAVAGVRAGLVEIPLAVFGALAVTVAAPALPYAMGFAAGGMLFVISDEIVPETHSRGHERVATLGTMLGVVVMLSLDVALAP
ncbi:ZIP family metal transporter [Halomarina pelagica]|uniref:ZIP family metal transporter n=1 Tax=Halomarina pelagica TaxID=2961599 RepID=UPI0020C4D50E|nr:ZIP family metal transporter [Halomarina sp. BND7]